MCPFGHVISTSADTGCLLHCYADDTLLYIKTAPTPSAARSHLSTCLKEMMDWMSIHFLQFNKTESLLIEMLHQDVFYPHLTFDDQIIHAKPLSTIWKTYQHPLPNPVRCRETCPCLYLLKIGLLECTLYKGTWPEHLVAPVQSEQCCQDSHQTKTLHTNYIFIALAVCVLQDWLHNPATHTQIHWWTCASRSTGADDTTNLHL